MVSCALALVLLFCDQSCSFFDPLIDRRRSAVAASRPLSCATRTRRRSRWPARVPAPTVSSIDGPLGARIVRTDGEGHFVIAARSARSARTGCSCEADGFIADPATAASAVETPTPLTITLRVAPISEAVVVLGRAGAASAVGGAGDVDGHRARGHRGAAARNGLRRAPNGARIHRRPQRAAAAR